MFYLCEHNACVIRQQELDFTDARYICEKTGIWTRDGILWFSSSGEEIEPPDSVTFHIWTAYSPFTTWVQIVKDWMKTKGDTGKRKTFVNTTLGETWRRKLANVRMLKRWQSGKSIIQRPFLTVWLTDRRYRLPAGPRPNARMGMGAG
ncbi:terminase gpA endonuclease subunit [Escherichia coli]